MKTIKPINNNGGIQIKFNLDGRQYRFSPIPGGKYENGVDIITVENICRQISIDISLGDFDKSLNKYTKRVKNNLVYLLDLVDIYIKDNNIPLKRRNGNNWFRQTIVNANPKLNETKWLLDSNLANSTLRQRIGFLRRCFDWAIGEGLVEKNPWKNIKVRVKVDKNKIRPFSRKEIALIIKGYEIYKPHYVNFVKFLFLTGCRISEAIGMKWEKVLEDKLIIDRSLSIDKEGNGYTRKEKGTKKEQTVEIKLYKNNGEPTELKLLLDSIERVDDRELIFKSVRGKTISDAHYRTYVWKFVLDKMDITYRNPHTTRHTFASICIEQGIPLTSIAYLLGHSNIQEVIKTYGHLINKPDSPIINFDSSV